MDANTATILVVALFALVVIGAFIAFRGQSSAEMRGPLGWLFRVRGKNPQAPASRVKTRDINAGKDMRANVQDFQSRDIDAEGNVEFGGDQPRPKAPPPSRGQK